MEITNEIKAKVFAQYLGQKVWYNGTGSTNSIMDGNKLYSNDYKLLLRPLSAITDEDAIEVANLNYVPEYFDGDNKSAANLGRYWVKQIREMRHDDTPKYVWLTFQYLQSKGYDLPHYLLGGKTLKEAGLAIYEQEKSPA